MRLTNIYNLPTPIVEAVRRDPYSKGDAAFSVTELIDAPQVAALKRKHEQDIERDVSDFTWTLMGRALHHVLEEYGRRAGLEEYVEQRLYAELDGWRISGGMDLWRNDGRLKIVDYKMTSSRAVGYPKPQWEAQLNSYAWLFEMNGLGIVDELEIVAIIRDHEKKSAQMQPSYPQSAMLPIKQRLWPMEERLAFLRDRLRVHAAVLAGETFDEPPPPCSDEERWKRGEVWAVMKPGGKRASSLCDSEQEAEERARGVGGYVEHRPGLPLRCMDYCDVAAFCTQWRAEREQELRKAA